MNFKFYILISLANGIFTQTIVETSTNMNGAYLLSNPNLDSSVQFSTEYEEYENSEYFDVYSPPISSKYAEVYWTMMYPVQLDSDIISRFSGKTMAIIGYEVDQVMKTETGDVSVPITWAYNHHYGAFITGTYSELDAIPNKHMKNTIFMGFESTVKKQSDNPSNAYTSTIPATQYFSEANGGEFRKSFHGYPPGFAQLIDSPTMFSVTPMQIDTKNRFYNGSDFQAGALPASSTAPPDAMYSGLLECPCTTRTERELEIKYGTATTDECDTKILEAEECFKAARKIGINNAKNETVADNKLPSRCSVLNSVNENTIFFNDIGESEAKCGGGSSQWYGQLFLEEPMVMFKIELDGSTSNVKITMTGPSDKWFAVAFGAPMASMTDKPYVIVIDGHGNVSERKLGDHTAGRVLEASVSVISNSVEENQRTVVMSRSFKGITYYHYTFSPESSSSIPCLSASGNTADFFYHGAKKRTAATLNLATVNSATCICNAGSTGSINGIEFHKNCLPEPTSDLLQQKNPTCFVDKYQGGLECCHHKVVLLDADQEQPDDIMTYHLKFRFHFQEYEPATETKLASHQNLIRLYWQTEAMAGEYDIPKCKEGTPRNYCIHEITSHWKVIGGNILKYIKGNFIPHSDMCNLIQKQVRDMLNECSERIDPTCTGNSTGFDGINLHYAGGHCHAPSCLSMELYNADTGDLICRHDPIYGKSNDIFDEEGYITIPPCLWGSEEQGLVPTTFLSFDTNLMSIKRNNNTYAHYGDMASWQMRGVLVKDPNE